MGRPLQRMLRTDEAAAYCGLSVNSFKQYIRIAPVNFGQSVRYDKKTLDAWLDTKSPSEPQTGDDWLGKLDEGQSAGH